MDAQSPTEVNATSELAATDTREHLETLIKRASAKDAIKDYNAAAELYSEATELQAKLNGELSLENADLLFAYGKALYNVAISKSDVLGSKVAGKAQTQSGPDDQTRASGSAPAANNLIQNAVSASVAGKGTKAENPESETPQNKSYFQFTGDENFDESDSEEEDENNGVTGEDGDDDDDFANAFEVLDLARILYHKKLNALDEENGKGKSTDSSKELKDMKEHLADTYDLQAEISLEAERFTDAVTDLRTVLELRESLFPMEDPSIAECHYKLSLALEFGAVRHEDDDSKYSGDRQTKVDDEMRNEAVTQMEKAIESCRVRLAKEQKILDNDSLDEDKMTAMKRKIANVKEIISDMEQRLVDLRRPPVSVEKGFDDSSETMLKGILGQIIGQSPSEQKSRLDAATKNANDLSSLVKRKPAASKSPQQSGSAVKRSAPEMEEGDLKRARVDSKDGSDS